LVWWSFDNGTLEDANQFLHLNSRGLKNFGSGWFL